MPFDPGGDYLLIFNLGGGVGVLKKRWLEFGGRAAFIIKDYIDRRFMKRVPGHGGKRRHGNPYHHASRNHRAGRTGRIPPLPFSPTCPTFQLRLPALVGPIKADATHFIVQEKLP